MWAVIYEQLDSRSAPSCGVTTSKTQRKNFSVLEMKTKNKKFKIWNLSLWVKDSVSHQSIDVRVNTQSYIVVNIGVDNSVDIVIEVVDNIEVNIGT